MKRVDSSFLPNWRCMHLSRFILRLFSSVQAKVEFGSIWNLGIEVTLINLESSAHISG